MGLGRRVPRPKHKCGCGREIPYPTACNCPLLNLSPPPSLSLSLRALYLPTFSHLLIVNKLLSLSFSGRARAVPEAQQDMKDHRTGKVASIAAESDGCRRTVSINTPV